MTAIAPEARPADSSKVLDWIERVGNKVPNPTIMFVYLIGVVALLSAVLSWAGVSVTDELAVPVPRDEFSQINEHLGGTWSIYDSVTGEPAVVPDFIVKEQTIAVRNLISVDGARFFFSSFVDNFAGFGVVAVVLVSMAGVGVAEHAGLMGALIRKIVKVAPAKWLTFILIFVGVLSSVATDAGYLILVPLAAAAFYSVGRHPLAGLAATFAGVGAVFAVNLLLTPSDAMLTEITNSVLTSLNLPVLEITQNFYFSIVSSFVLAAVVWLVTVRITQKRLGTFDGTDGSFHADEEVAPAHPGLGSRRSFEKSVLHGATVQIDLGGRRTGSAGVLGADVLDMVQHGLARYPEQSGDPIGLLPGGVQPEHLGLAGGQPDRSHVAVSVQRSRPVRRGDHVALQRLAHCLDQLRAGFALGDHADDLGAGCLAEQRRALRGGVGEHLSAGLPQAAHVLGRPASVPQPQVEKYQIDVHLQSQKTRHGRRARHQVDILQGGECRRRARCDQLVVIDHADAGARRGLSHHVLLRVEGVGVTIVASCESA